MAENTAEDLSLISSATLDAIRAEGLSMTIDVREPVEAPLAAPELAFMGGFIDVGSSRAAVDAAMIGALTSGNAEGIRPTANAPDNGMGGSAGNRDDAKKKADDAFNDMMRQQAANWNDWKSKYDNTNNPYDKYQMAKAKFEESTAGFARDSQGNIQWIAEGKKAGVHLDESVTRRRDGETQAQYEARLLKAYKEEMFDEKGNLKEKYRNSPNVYKFGAAIFSGAEVKKMEGNPEFKKEIGRIAHQRETDAGKQIGVIGLQRQRVESFRGELDGVARIENDSERKSAMEKLLTNYSDLGTADWRRNRAAVTVEDARKNLTEKDTELARQEVEAGAQQQEAVKVRTDITRDGQEEGLDDLKAAIGGSAPTTAAAAKPASIMGSQFAAARDNISIELPDLDTFPAPITVLPLKNNA